MECMWFLVFMWIVLFFVVYDVDDFQHGVFIEVINCRRWLTFMHRNEWLYDHLNHPFDQKNSP